MGKCPTQKIGGIVWGSLSTGKRPTLPFLCDIIIVDVAKAIIFALLS